jgi:hypothetical protein
MSENRGFGSSQEDAQYWPPLNDAPSEPRYQAPGFYNSFSAASSAWSETLPIPAHILRQAEARVAAQKRFYKHLFIYLGIVTALWLVGISIFITRYYDSNRMVGIFVPLFITLVGGVLVTYSYFNAYVWGKKSDRERVMQEAHRLML